MYFRTLQAHYTLTHEEWFHKQLILLFCNLFDLFICLLKMLKIFVQPRWMPDEKYVLKKRCLGRCWAGCNRKCKKKITGERKNPLSKHCKKVCKSGCRGVGIPQDFFYKSCRKEGGEIKDISWAWIKTALPKMELTKVVACSPFFPHNALFRFASFSTSSSHPLCQTVCSSSINMRWSWEDPLDATWLLWSSLKTTYQRCCHSFISFIINWG